ncbi:MAG: ABC transporter ATP-binding protein [Actinomycetota bacterium]|nr:ABC transporter ATP-binding protein [Actinomycetota bacterium]
MTEGVVEVCGLCKRYGDRLVVDDVDFDVHEGEIVGLLGRNGAGKTTTVECVSGLRRRDGGSVRVLGLDPDVDGEGLRTRVGSQLQDSGLPDRIRVAEAIELFRGPRAMVVDGLLAAFGLEQHARQSFAALSGGQRQRLFLVLALLNRPELVILDELTQGLDPAARRDVWDAIRAVRDGGTTVLLVTHYMDEAEALCDRVVLMDEGRIVDAGRPGELIARNAPWATIRFDTASTSVPLDHLRNIEGVADACTIGPTTVVHGHRSMIAYVCARLVASGQVPEDLAVSMPDLEEAVVAVLTGSKAGRFDQAGRAEVDGARQ